MIIWFNYLNNFWHMFPNHLLQILTKYQPEICLLCRLFWKWTLFFFFKFSTCIWVIYTYNDFCARSVQWKSTTTRRFIWTKSEDMKNHGHNMFPKLTVLEVDICSTNEVVGINMEVDVYKQLSLSKITNEDLKETIQAHIV